MVDIKLAIKYDRLLRDLGVNAGQHFNECMKRWKELTNIRKTRFINWVTWYDRNRDKI